MKTKVKNPNSRDEDCGTDKRGSDRGDPEQDPRCKVDSQSAPSKNGNNNGRDSRGRFTTGNGHGQGRKVGSMNAVTIAAKEVFESEAEEIARRAVEMALDGDRSMIKLVLERCVSVKKSETVSIPDLPDIDSLESVIEAESKLLSAVADSQISIDAANTVSAMLSRARSNYETIQLAEKIEDLQRQVEEHLQSR